MVLRYAYHVHTCIEYALFAHNLHDFINLNKSCQENLGLAFFLSNSPCWPSTFSLLG